MTLIANIVNNIAAHAAPVLFLDTCTLLDVVRAPLRNKPDEVRCAMIYLASAHKAPPTIHLLVGSPVQTEWNTHILERENECGTAILACNVVSAVCGHVALPAVPGLPAGVLTMPAVLRQLSADLLAACTLIENDGNTLIRVVDRINNYRRPVKHPHGQGAKDAVNLEHAIETTTHLRNVAFGGLCIFVSSNTKDFAAPGSTNLHADLTGVCNPINLQYAVSLAQAENILTGAGWVP